ncbi:MAG: SDR family oxidoreductase [Alphaproteobacteria bacterium]|nr:SDR family oxidoreductase [Alphaproteobacteria bacterium]
MSGRLAGKTAIVIGAGAIGPGWGNGKATAVLFAREGASVLCVDINPRAAEETCAIVAREGGTAAPFAADWTVSARVEAMAAECLARFGRIDVLHNNVGIVEVGGPVELDEARWDRLIDVNLKGMYLACRHVLPTMQRQGKGAIVNVSSLAAYRSPGYPCASYMASKAAVLGLTRSVALQYAAQGIRCNAILPGLLNTPMVHAALKDTYGPGGIEAMVATRDKVSPTGKMGDAWDVAYAALYLASDEAKYVNGAELAVDGGLSVKVA